MAHAMRRRLFCKGWQSRPALPQRREHRLQRNLKGGAQIIGQLAISINLARVSKRACRMSSVCRPDPRARALNASLCPASKPLKQTISTPHIECTETLHGAATPLVRYCVGQRGSRCSKAVRSAVTRTSSHFNGLISAACFATSGLTFDHVASRTSRHRIHC